MERDRATSARSLLERNRGRELLLNRPVGHVGRRAAIRLCGLGRHLARLFAGLLTAVCAAQIADAENF